MGRILPWAKVQICDSAGLSVSPGELGEVRIRGDEVVAGYPDMPADTAACFRDGWYHPGDLGRFDEDGTLIIEGRIDDLPNFGRRKSLSSAIKAALLCIPAIVDIAALAFEVAGTQRPGIAYGARRISTRIGSPAC